MLAMMCGWVTSEEISTAGIIQTWTLTRSSSGGSPGMRWGSMTFLPCSSMLPNTQGRVLWFMLVTPWAPQHSGWWWTGSTCYSNALYPLAWPQVSPDEQHDTADGWHGPCGCCWTHVQSYQVYCTSSRSCRGVYYTPVLFVLFIANLIESS